MADSTHSVDAQVGPVVVVLVRNARFFQARVKNTKVG